MRIELDTIPYSMKPVLRNLLELYEYDSSEFNGRDLSDHGLYEYKYLDHYWTETGRYAYFIRVDDQLAGFALVRTLDPFEQNARYSMAEFFIVRKYRRQGVGKQAATLLFGMLPGHWEVSQEADNIIAQTFWKRVIGDYTKGEFNESSCDIGPLLQFESIIR